MSLYKVYLSVYRLKICSVLFKMIHSMFISNRTWGVGRGNEGWGDSSADVADGKDWPSAHSHQVYDLVPEFEPGKPWKVCILLPFADL